MSKKYIAIQDCEYQGKLYRTGESVLFTDDVEICNLCWKLEDEILKEREAARVETAAVDRMTSDEKTEKIKDLNKRLKEAEKALKTKDAK